MSGRIIKVIINVAAFIFISWYIKKTKTIIKNDGGDVYELRIPSILKTLCLIFIIFGTVFAIAAVILSYYTNQITKGHYCIGMAMVIIGIIGMFFSVNWKMTITPTDITYRNIWGIKKEFRREDLTRYEIGKSGELIVWFGDTKINIDPMTENVSRFFQEIESWKYE